MKARILLAALMSTFLGASLLYGQAAQLTGRVTDPSGAVVPGASVSIQNTKTGIVVKTATNEEGYYTAVSLLPSTYTVAAEHTGFKRVVQEGVLLQVGQIARVDFALQIGATQESVTVTGEAPLLDSATATVSTVIENRRITDLPMNGRNALALMMLVTGVRPQAGPTSMGFADYGNALTAISINGGPSGYNAFIMDGTSNTMAAGGLNMNPVVEAIQEFRIQTNTMSAEYGFTAGGVINLITKSGTNNLHGSLYEFVRNNAFDARNAFDTSVAPFRYNQFGGSLGGPVYIPGLYRGRNRTFFFFNYEEFRYLQYTFVTTTVATPEERRGDFSHLADSNGNLIPIYDPTTTRLNPDGSGYVRDPFPGNIVPNTRFDPVSVNFLQLYQGLLPNRTPSNPFTHSLNYYGSARRIQSMRQYTARVDHQLTAQNSLRVRYMFDWNRTNTDSLFSDPTMSQRFSDWKPRNVNVSDTHSFSPRILNELKLGIARIAFTYYPSSLGHNWPQKLGLPSIVPADVLPTLDNGLPDFPSSSWGKRGQLTWQLSDIVTVIRGSHVLKIGAEGQLQRVNYLFKQNPTGSFSFGPGLTGNPQSPSGTGSSLATFLLGTVSSAGVSTADGITTKNYVYSAFIQDEWKVTPSLTLNLGLRQDYTSAPNETHNRFSNFDPYKTDPNTGLLGRMVYAGVDYGRSAFTVPAVNLGPRVALAWDLFGKKRTVLRAGYGIFYMPFNTYNLTLSSSAGFTNADTSYAPAGANYNYPAFQFKDGYPYAPIPVAGAKLGPSGFLGQGVEYEQSIRKLSMSQQWTVSIQQQLGNTWLIDAAYSGNHGTHLLAGGYDLDQLDPQFLSLGMALQDPVPNPYAGRVPGSLGEATLTKWQSLLPYPYYYSMYIDTPSMGNSIYHAFFLTVQKRLSSGVTLLASYTNAKLISDSARALIDWEPAEQVGYVGYQNGYNRRAERSIDPTDVSQRLVVSGFYELPFGAGRRWTIRNRAANYLAGGWQANFIATIQGGTPITVTGADNFLAWRPNSTGQSAKLDNRSAARWFNADVFVNPPIYTFGNVGRVLPDVRGPGAINFDLSVIKDFELREKIRLQFRAEAFNAFNHVNLGFPDTNFWPGPDGHNSSDTFGTIYSARDPRVVQLALKLIF